MVAIRLRELRHDVRGIRRTLAPTRDAVHKIVDNRVELDEGELFPRDVEIAFGDAYDKLLRASEGLESSRDALSGVRDYVQGKIANDQNEVMKRLTVIASLLLVPTFIVGLYGQNFRHIPELHWGFGYWWSWSLIIVTTIGQLAFFRCEALDLAADRRQREQQAAVVVVGREDVGDDLLLVAAAGADRELLAQSADAPLACQLHRLRVGEGERLDDVAAHQVGLREAGELEDAAPDREHAPVAVGHEQSGVRRRVVVVEQLEEKAEAAVTARRRLVGKPLARVDVEERSLQRGQM